MKHELNEYYRQQAREMEDEGALEFDDVPDVSETDRGAYVAAWVWIPHPSADD